MDRAKALGQAKGEHGIGLKAKKGAVWVIIDRTTSPVGEVRGIPHMVPVTVGEQKGVRLDLFFLEEIEEAFRGIDGKTVTAEVDKVGIGGGESAAIV